MNIRYPAGEYRTSPPTRYMILANAPPLREEKAVQFIEAALSSSKSLEDFKHRLKPFLMCVNLYLKKETPKVAADLIVSQLGSSHELVATVSSTPLWDARMFSIDEFLIDNEDIIGEALWQG